MPELLTGQPDRLKQCRRIVKRFGDLVIDTVERKSPAGFKFVGFNIEGTQVRRLRHWIPNRHLRTVWRRDPVALREQVPQILMGLETRPVGSEPLEQGEEDRIPERVGAVSWNESLEQRSKSMFSDFPPRYRRALMLMRLHPDSKFFRPYFPKFMTDWESGEFLCQLKTDFQCAVFSLFRQSWRARICRECKKLFVAARHPQMFCSVRCSTVVKLRRNRAFWKERGTVQRRKRNQKRRRSDKKPK